MEQTQRLFGKRANTKRLIQEMAPRYARDDDYDDADIAVGSALRASFAGCGPGRRY